MITDEWVFSMWLAGLKKQDEAIRTIIGVDWAKDSGMNRGDIIKHDENVIHVRFKAVDARL